VKSGTKKKKNYLRRPEKKLVFSRVVDPDPDWIRIQRLCGSGSVLGIRILDPDPGVR
jgi:hypothetical protein